MENLNEFTNQNANQDAAWQTWAATTDGRRLIAASHAVDQDFGENLSHLTPEQIVALLSA